MTTYDLKDKEGRVFAFEIENWILGRWGVVRVVRTIPGAVIKRMPVFLSWFREEKFCEFEVDGHTYVAWEPFGDNSRFWIGPEPTHWLPQTEKVWEAFKKFSGLRAMVMSQLTERFRRHTT